MHTQEDIDNLFSKDEEEVIRERYEVTDIRDGFRTSTVAEMG